jgi:hypothetical protein
VADVFVLDPDGRAARGRDGGAAPAAGLDGGLGVHRQDPVARLEPRALVNPWYRSKITAALAAQSGSRGEIQDWYCQGLTGCSAKIRSTEDADSLQSVPAQVSSASSSGPIQRDSGPPVAAGNWQASATTAARVSSLIRRGRPERGRSLSPPRPRAANWPRHLRTVSTVIRRSAAIRALPRPQAAASTIWARSRSRCAVFAPQARVFSIMRSAAASVTGTARDSDMTAPGGNHICAIPLPGTGS